MSLVRSFRPAWFVAFACLACGSTPLRAEPPPSARPGPLHVDYRVVVWFRRDQPLATFKYEVYDLRKGQYTRAVDDWIALLKGRFPAFEVLVRDVDLRREQGETESLKVGAVIRRELLFAASLEGVFVGAGPNWLTSGVGSPTRGTPGSPSARPSPLGIAPGTSPRIDFGPPRSGYPQPVPFPRPHP